MFKGSIVALVTPFSDNGEIDTIALSNLVKWHIENGTDALVCCGTTGETSTLTFEEKLTVISTCVRAAEKKIPVIANTGTNNTMSSVHLTRRAKEIGVDGCMAVVPYYNRPTQMGCVEHFKQIANVGLPLIIYHHPKRTGVTLQKDTFVSLSRIENIIGIKEASCDVEIIQSLGNNFPLAILSGDDALTLDLMQLGSVGVISVCANIIPKQWKEMVLLAEQKKFVEAKKILQEYKLFLDALNLETNPQCIKYAMSLIGLCEANIRLPLLEPSSITKEKIRLSLQKIKNSF